VKFLIEHKALVDKSDTNEWTALHHACLAGNHQIAALLLDNGADINRLNEFADTVRSSMLWSRTASLSAAVDHRCRKVSRILRQGAARAQSEHDHQGDLFYEERQNCARPRQTAQLR